MFGFFKASYTRLFDRVGVSCYPAILSSKTFPKFFKPKLNRATNGILDGKKWQGRVSGNSSDIEFAIQTLNRHPHDLEELATLIREQRRNSLTKTLRDSNGYWY